MASAASIRFVARDDPARVVELGPEPFTIGRRAECEWRLSDRAVSRRHASVYHTRRGFVIENMGRNPLKINGTPVAEQVLQDGDIVQIGAAEFIVHVRADQVPMADPSGEIHRRTRDEEQSPDNPYAGEAEANRRRAVAPRTSAAAATTLAPVLTQRRLGPRLIHVGGPEPMTPYPLTAARVAIGRGGQCGIRVEGNTVSRAHAAIEKRSDGFYAVSLSTTNPMLVNHHVAKEARIYNGDNVQIGDHVFTFVSDRRQDARPGRHHVVVKERGPPKPVVGVAAILLILMGWVLIEHFVINPWRTKAQLDEAESLIDKGFHEQARSSLQDILGGKISARYAERGNWLMAQSVMSQAQALATSEKLTAAKQLLVAHLADYGAGAAAAPVWGLLDLVHYDLGVHLEANRDPKRAMREYLAVRTDSPLYDQAQAAVSRLWLNYQQAGLGRSPSSGDVESLLRKAEEHFAGRRYLIPAYDNAYNLYRAVLRMDPQNTIALSRIEHMMRFYRTRGDSHFDLEQWSQCHRYYQRYLLIDPGSSDVQRRLAQCHRNVVARASSPPVVAPSQLPSVDDPSTEQEKIRRALEDSGVQSDWILRYLFEGERGSAEADVPW